MRKFKIDFKIKKNTYCSACDDYHTHAIVMNGVFTSYICLQCGYKTGSDYYTYSCPTCHAPSSRSEWDSICLLDNKCDKDTEKVEEDFGFLITIEKRPCESCEHFAKDKEKYSFVKSENHGSTATPLLHSEYWTEVHKCLHCGTEYEFENSSC